MSIGGVIGALPNGGDRRRAELAHKFRFLAGFVAGETRTAAQAKLLINFVLAAVGVGGEQVNGDEAFEARKSFSNTRPQNAVGGQGAVNIADQMPQVLGPVREY